MRDRAQTGDCGAAVNPEPEVNYGKTDYNGRRGEQEQGEIKYFYGKAGFVDEVAKTVENYLRSKKMKTQVIRGNDGIIIQGKKYSNIVGTVLGIEKAATVVVLAEGRELKLVIGGAKWIDKGLGLAIGVFVHPILLTAGWGTYKQKRLLSDIEKEVERFLQSRE